MTRFDEIAEKLEHVKERIAVSAAQSGRESREITLVVVTKTFPISDVEILKQLGVRLW